MNGPVNSSSLRNPGKRAAINSQQGSCLYIYIFSGILIFLCITTGCSDVFTPRQENDQYFFSIFGMLDASVDTQWVRVMPVREDLFLEPGPIDATVTLEHIETGETVILEDSLFSYRLRGEFYAWNFWTTTDIEPEQTYRVTATRSDGESSSAQVTLPSDFPTPLVVRSPIDPVTVVQIHKSIEHLVDIQTIYHGQDTSTGRIRVKSFPHLQDTVSTMTDYHAVYLRLFEDDLVNFPTPFRRLVFVAAGSPNFPEFGSIDGKILALPDIISNIQNGVGYLAGIVSKTVPIQTCYAEDGATPVPCPAESDPW